jgi:hypothetical protein
VLSGAERLGRITRSGLSATVISQNAGATFSLHLSGREHLTVHGRH